jgi:uncharacterized membrane protein
LLISYLTTACLFENGLLAGLFLGSCMVEHAMRDLGAGNWIAYKQAKERVYGPIMPAFFMGDLALTIVTAIVAPAHWTVGLATILLASSMAITMAVHLPLNRAFGSWSNDAVPITWMALRRRWRDWNWVRSIPVFVAFGLIISATLPIATR